MVLKKKKRKEKLTEDEKIAIEFMKTAMKARKKMGAKVVGIRKA
ncbi:hypothetical protein [Ureibacillus chungkukjangi]|nr:hypothetical protein [Ureibacillus chungkukjangi]